MREKKRRWMIARLAVAGIVAGSTSMAPVHASESLPKAGVEVLREQYETEYSPIVFANVDPFIYIRSEARENAGYQGKLYKEGAASVIGKQGEWLEVVSGDVRGYVRKSEMLMGEQAKKKAKEAGKIAEVTADILNVRKGMGTDTEIIGQLKKGRKRKYKERQIPGGFRYNMREKKDSSQNCMRRQKHNLLMLSQRKKSSA